MMRININIVNIVNIDNIVNIVNIVNNVIITIIFSLVWPCNEVVTDLAESTLKTTSQNA